MSKMDERERVVLDEYETQWVEQGYRVVREPRGSEVPEFLGSFQPDALLLGRDPKIVVEIVQKGAPHVEEKVRRLRSLLASKGDWRLEILYTGEAGNTLPTASLDDIRSTLRNARTTAYTVPSAALLLTWAALEALARRLEPQKATRPQSPGRVVELLAGAGHVTPTEASLLRIAVKLRNGFIHGDLSIQLSAEDVALALEVAENLLLRLEATL